MKCTIEYLTELVELEFDARQAGQLLVAHVIHRSIQEISNAIAPPLGVDQGFI